MNEKMTEGNGKCFLVLLFPFWFLIIFLVSTWKILLAFLMLAMVSNLWQQYQWQKWCQQVDPVFHQMISENQGAITPMDLAIKGNFPGSTAKRYLDGKASEFGTSVQKTLDGSDVYYFINVSILGNILESSEPVAESNAQPVTKNARSLLVAPTEMLGDSEAEDQPLSAHKPDTRSLEEQLVFGSLIQSELAKRLNVYSSTVYKRRDDPDFPEWSRSKDPDGIAWTYSPRTKEFFPVDEG